MRPGPDPICIFSTRRGKTRAFFQNYRSYETNYYVLHLRQIFFTREKRSRINYFRQNFGVENSDF